VSDPVERGGILFFWHGWPSQSFPSPFEVDSVRYDCAEQFMMAEKARLFGDTRMVYDAFDISPASVLDAGCGPGLYAKNRHRGDHEVWAVDFAPEMVAQRCREIVRRGNFAKFTQNHDLRDLLLRTGELMLAEASPTDRIWGIGLAASDERAVHPTQWLGKNWLGKALMRVRAELRKTAS
jgi:ribA/ribD-fused uncharacterized protein